MYFSRLKSEQDLQFRKQTTLQRFILGVFNITSQMAGYSQDHTSQDHFCSLIDGFPV